ncbi:MAG: diguanylate cyclase [Nitrospirae bacterium]|nr:MAG: diguanylate cyclase [Nitrospirota bacterium]
MTENVYDPLTGVWSRFGLMFFASHYLKLLRRMKREAILFVIGMDGMPADGPCEPAQETRLQETARLLLRTFRTSDAVARIEPDVFAVLLLETSALAADALLFRLEDRLVDWQTEHALAPHQTLSLVMDRIHPDRELVFQDVLSRTVTALRRQQADKQSQGETTPPAPGRSVDTVLPDD